MSLRKILFIDRDGCLIEEPEDEQVDHFDKFRMMPGVIPALLRLQANHRPGHRELVPERQSSFGRRGQHHQRA